MEEEKVKTQSALERLQNHFNWSTPKESYYQPRVGLLKLNGEEDIQAELYSPEGPFARKLIMCQVRRDGESVVDFSVGEHGLESVGFKGLEFSFRGSPRVKINGGAGIGYTGGLSVLHISGVELQKFQSLDNNFTDWVENMKSAGGIGDVPLSFTVNI